MSNTKRSSRLLAQVYNGSYLGAEPGGSQIQGLPQLKGEFKANLSNLIRSCLMTKAKIN